MAHENLLSVQEAAAFLGITVSTLYGWACHRQISYVKSGRLLKFRRSVLEAYVERRSVEARATYVPRRKRAGSIIKPTYIRTYFEVLPPVKLTPEEVKRVNSWDVPGMLTEASGARQFAFIYHESEPIDPSSIGASPGMESGSLDEPGKGGDGPSA
jgi:excisionase family DNA binding protein